MRNKLMSLLIVSILILVTPVVSSIEDFEVGAIGGEKTLCPTHTVSISVPVENTGDEEGSYSISLSGAAQKWAVVAPTGFSLEPGEVETVYIWITPSSKTLPGIYNLDVSIDGGDAGEEEINYDIVVETCHNVNIYTSESSKESCPGEITNYDLTVENTGEYTEDYELFLTGIAKEWATLSKTNIKLDKGESEEIVLSVKAPIGEIGNYDLTVTAESKDSDAIDDEEITILLESCYDYSIDSPKDKYVFCDHTHAKIPILIKNEGKFDNTYDLNVEGPEWAELENNELFLMSGDSKVINLTVFPDYYETGDYEVGINAVSETGELEIQKSLSIEVTPCFITELNIPIDEDTICAESSKTYEVSLTNSGNYKEPYSIYVEGPSWAKVDRNFVEIEPGESDSVNLIVDAPEGAEEETITVIAKSQEPSETSDQEDIDIEVVSKEVCFSFSLSAELNEIDVARGEGALIPISLENKGKEIAEYSLDVSGAGTSFVELKPSSLTVEEGTSKTAHLYIAIPEEAEKDNYVLSVSGRLKGGTISSSDRISVNVVSVGEGINIEDVEEGTEETEETEEETEEVVDVINYSEETEEDENKTGIFDTVNNRVSGFVSGAGNRITGAFAGIEGFSIVKNNWKYIVGAVVVILIIVLLWQGTKEEDEEVEKENTEDKSEKTEDKKTKDTEEKKDKNKEPKKKKEIVKKIRELLEEED